jgi:pimeloyl-ACP methyl ester carboxylesterase
MGRKLDRTLAVLNGLVGDYLARTNNGLATEMACYHDGARLALEAHALAAAHTPPSPRAVVLVHGVLCDEGVFRFADGSDYGSLLARDLGYTPFYVRYNSGLPIADTGAELARLLTRLVAAYPVALEELLLIGYSMGGLLIRRACHVAALGADPWLEHVRRIIYLGTPHLGAPAERVGRSIAQILQLIDDPYTRLVADIADLRSEGIKDLGHADLRHEDRARERTFFSLRDAQHPLPLLPALKHYLIAGSLAIDPRLAMLFGDAIVPVASATYAARTHAIDANDANVINELLPEKQVKVLPGLSHLALAHDADVYERIKAICSEDAR